MARNRFIVIISLIVIVVVAGGAVIVNSQLHNTMRTMQFIESRMRGDTFLDYDQSICVYSPEDVGWFKKGDNWYIQFGKLRLEFTPEDLRDPEFMAQVGRIKLDIRGNLEEGNLKFYWLDTELSEWVPS